MTSFQLTPGYYKSFGSYRNLFLNCPRIHFNGYYVLRDRYIRVGVKDERNPIAPINVTYFYRYLRFLEDGTVIYHVHLMLSRSETRSLDQNKWSNSSQKIKSTNKKRKKEF